MTKGYMQIETDEWIEPVRKGFIDQCCSCGLTHVIDFEVVDKNKKKVPGVTVQFKLRIDQRKTAASRRKLKFSKDD